MTNISHLRKSEKPLERAWFWICDYSWHDADNFEELQTLGIEIIQLQANLEHAQALVADAHKMGVNIDWLLSRLSEYLDVKLPIDNE